LFVATTGAGASVAIEFVVVSWAVAERIMQAAAAVAARRR
jgi:hypothetical protein